MKFKLALKNSTEILCFIIGLSVLIKIIFFLMFFQGGMAQISQPDTSSYLEPALSLINQGNYQDMFERTPGYPTFIAAFFWLFGQKLEAIIIAQIILGGVWIAEGYFMAKRLFSEPVGILAALLLACNMLFFGFNLLILSETLFAVLIGAVFLVGSYLFSGHPRFFGLSFLLGLFLALSTLTRPISYYLMVPMTMGLAYYAYRSSFRFWNVWLMIFLFVLPTLVLVGGWKVRNKILFDTYSYSDISTYNFYWHYAGHILSQELGITDDAATALLADKLKQQPLMSVSERQAFMNHEAFSILRQYPKDLALEMMAGFPKLMLGSDFSWVLYFLYPDINPQDLSSAKNNVINFQFNQLPHYNFGILTLVGLTAIFSLSLVLFYFLMMVGIIQSAKKNHRPYFISHLFLIGCLLYFVAMSSSPISYSRFRLPMELPITVYASFGLSYLWMRRKVHLKKKAICYE